MMERILVPCCGEEHEIRVTRRGRILFLNHTKEEIKAEEAAISLGGEPCGCMEKFGQLAYENELTLDRMDNPYPWASSLWRVKLKDVVRHKLVTTFISKARYCGITSPFLLAVGHESAGVMVRRFCFAYCDCYDDNPLRVGWSWLLMAIKEKVVFNSVGYEFDLPLGRIRKSRLLLLNRYVLSGLSEGLIPAVTYLCQMEDDALCRLKVIDGRFQSATYLDYNSRIWIVPERQKVYFV